MNRLGIVLSLAAVSFLPALQAGLCPLCELGLCPGMAARDSARDRTPPCCSRGRAAASGMHAPLAPMRGEACPCGGHFSGPCRCPKAPRPTVCVPGEHRSPAPEAPPAPVLLPGAWAAPTSGEAALDVPLLCLHESIPTTVLRL